MSKILTILLKIIAFLKHNCRKVTCISGFSGTAIVVLATILTAIPYRGVFDERYSFLNHNISELGEIGVSELASVFNLSLMIGGFCFVVFMIGFSFYMDHKTMHIISLVGVLAAIGIIFVGLFPVIPEQSLVPHTVAALTFFIGGFLYSLLTTLFLIFSQQTQLSKWFVLPSSIVTISFVAFLFLPSLIYSDLGTEQFLAGLSGPDRPAFWLPSFLEWMILFTLVIWIMLISVSLLREDRELDRFMEDGLIESE